MFNPEKLLGGLILGSARGNRGGLGGLVSGGAALGLLGVAMEAVEHFMNTPRGEPPKTAGTPPPPPPSDASAHTRAKTPPPPPRSPLASDRSKEADAVLLIRAMIAAANADGMIDQKERNHILERLRTVELSPEEHTFMFQELLTPSDLDAIVDRVSTPEMARQVYTVSLIAIDVDTDQERLYLETLARRLGLDEASVQTIHRALAPA